MNPKHALVALTLTLALCAPAVAAQEPPTLDRVEELARLGRVQEARDVVGEWWRTAARKASRRDTQRALWLRGQITSDATQAALDFSRLVVEYPGGPYSDLALLRLGQASYAAGDSAAAAAQVARLLREYPNSPVRDEAKAWLATAGPVPRPEAPPAGAAPAGVTAAAPVTGAAPADSAPARRAAPADSRPAAGAAAAEGGAGEFTVQVGAFSTVARAESLLGQLADAGFEGRLARVPGSDLVRVRLGRFDSAEGAEAILWKVRDRGFTATVARDAQREEPVTR